MTLMPLTSQLVACSLMSQFRIVSDCLETPAKQVLKKYLAPNGKP